MNQNEVKEESVTSSSIIKLLWKSILFALGICIIAFSIYWAINFFDLLNNSETVFQETSALIKLLIMAVCGLIGVVLIK